MKGLAGAVLGGIIASIPSFISVYFFHYMIAYLYILIPMGVYYGYTKLGGKLDGIVPPIFTAVFSIGAVFGVEIVYYYFELKKFYKSMGVSFSEVIDFRFNDMELITGDTAFALVCVVIGIFVAISSFKGSSKSILKDNEAVLASAVPRRQVMNQPVIQQVPVTPEPQPQVQPIQEQEVVNNTIPTGYENQDPGFYQDPTKQQ